MVSDREVASEVLDPLDGRDAAAVVFFHEVLAQVCGGRDPARIPAPGMVFDELAAMPVALMAAGAQIRGWVSRPSRAR